MKHRVWNRVGLALSVGLCLAFTAKAASAQETKETITVENVDRSYVVHLPKGYDEKQHYPVVVLLHGLNQEADDMERLTRFNELADKDGVIAVYPSALQGRWNVGVQPTPERNYRRGPYRRPGWGGYPGGGYPRGGGQREPAQQNRSAHADDIDFFNHMLDKLANKFSVDASRVYFAGLSFGGMMATRVACSLTDRVAAVATVGAAMPKTMVCVPSRPLPVVMINGTSDPVVKYDGGVGKNGRIQTISVEDTAKDWAKLNHCAEKPNHSKLPSKGKGGMETKVATYEGCQEGAQVVLYSVKGAGNTWPGGEQYEVENTIGKTSEDLNANDVIWSFLVTKKLAGQSGDKK
jgi:polyhydroxybutyrate depolymerase